MGKVKQRNWLLIITGILLISSFSIMFVTMSEDTDSSTCSLNGVVYDHGDMVPDHNGKRECICQKDGEIICNQESTGFSYSSFSSDNLTFEYSFLNFLDKSDPDLTRVFSTNIDSSDSSLEIYFEKEGYCNENGTAPLQVGYYQMKEDSLMLSSVTNGDPAVYNKACVISNKFRITGIVLPDRESFLVSHQMENGSISNLNACLYRGKLYGENDSFFSVEKNTVCSCISTKIVCDEDLE